MKPRQRILLEPEKFSCRQRLSIEAHIARIRNPSTTSSILQHQSRVRRRRGDDSKTNTEALVGASKTNTIAIVAKSKKKQAPVSAEILKRTAHAWLGATSSTRTKEFVEQAAATHCTLKDDHEGSSSPEPGSDSKGSDSSETDCTSDTDTSATSQDFEIALHQKEEDIATLNANLSRTFFRLSETTQENVALKIKLAEQQAQRLNDKDKVDYAFEQYHSLENRCDDLEEQLREAKMRLDETAMKHKDAVRSKDQQLGELTSNHEQAKSAAQHDHAAALARKERLFQRTIELSQRREVEHQQALAKVIAERDEAIKNAGRKQRELVEAAKTTRKALKAEKEALLTETSQMRADYADTVQRDRATLQGLVARNTQLAAEHDTMSQLLQARFPNVGNLQRVIEAGKNQKQEEQNISRTKRHLEYQIENLLDKMQQMQGQFTRHQHAEQDARSMANQHQRKVEVLKTDIARLKTQLRDAANQIESLQRGDVSSGRHCAALEALELENSELREQSQIDLGTINQLQDKNSKFDEDNLHLSIENDFLEAALIKQKNLLSVFQDSKSMHMQELATLRKLCRGHIGATSTEQEKENKRVLCLLRETADRHKALADTNLRLKQELETAQAANESLEKDFAKQNRQFDDALDFWRSLYFTEAVSTTERLHEDIRRLKAEKGETYFVEPIAPRNPEVSDRNALRYAICCGMDDVDFEDLPALLRDQEFCRTSHSATYEALITLRPHGWKPLWENGKVWLKPLYAPFSEEDAAQHLAEQGRNGVRSNGSSSNVAGSSPMSMTYARKVQVNPQQQIPNPAVGTPSIRQGQVFAARIEQEGAGRNTHIPGPSRLSPSAVQPRSKLPVVIGGARTPFVEHTPALQPPRPTLPFPRGSRVKVRSPHTESYYNQLESDNKLDYHKLYGFIS